jgi:hypothetical protein
MGAFADALQRFGTKADRNMSAVFVATVVELRDSVKYGSSVTGAPALPVAPNEFPRAGALRDSVTVTYPDPNTALIYTASPYGPDVEDNPKGHTFHSGAAHGWKLTIAAAPRVVDVVAQRIAGYAP